jgi:hypothetical protein
MQSKINDFRKTRSSIGCKRCVTIDTYIYVFRKSNGRGGNVNKTVIDKQMQILNDAFAKTPFKFELIEANFEVDDFYFSNFLTESEIASNENPRALTKKWPRRGNYSALNMYFGGCDSTYSFATSPGAGGLATSPCDGVYNVITTVPQVYALKNLGYTVVHEVSHRDKLPTVCLSTSSVK